MSTRPHTQTIATVLLACTAVIGCLEEDPGYAGTGDASGGTSGTQTDDGGTGGSDATSGSSGTGGSSGTSTATDTGSSGSGDGATGTGGSGETTTGDTTSQAATNTEVHHLIFVSSSSHTGDLGGLSAADEICASLAGAAALSGTFKALMSDANEAANQRVSIVGAVANSMGEIVANSGADLWDGTIDTAVAYDEQGAATNEHVWSGANPAGDSTSNDCDGWTSISGNARRGVANANDDSWISAGPRACDLALRIYCISE